MRKSWIIAGSIGGVCAVWAIDVVLVIAVLISIPGEDTTPSVPLLASPGNGIIGFGSPIPVPSNPDLQGGSQTPALSIWIQ